MDSVRHVITHILMTYLLNVVVAYDVASSIHQSLYLGQSIKEHRPGSVHRGLERLCHFPGGFRAQNHGGLGGRNGGDVGYPRGAAEAGRVGASGRAVQVEPMKPKFKAPATKCLKL
jgi:hypothetical protein